MTVEYVSFCPTCDAERLTFYGTLHSADADCPECGTVVISPAEFMEDER